MGEGVRVFQGVGVLVGDCVFAGVGVFVGVCEIAEVGVLVGAGVGVRVFFGVAVWQVSEK